MGVFPVAKVPVITKIPISQPMLQNRPRSTRRTNKTTHNPQVENRGLRSLLKLPLERESTPYVQKHARRVQRGPEHWPEGRGFTVGTCPQRQLGKGSRWRGRGWAPLGKLQWSGEGRGWTLGNPRSKNNNRINPRAHTAALTSVHLWPRKPIAQETALRCTDRRGGS